MACHKAQKKISLYFRKLFHKICKIIIEIAVLGVRIHVLPEKRNVLIPALCKISHLGYDLVHFTAALTSADVWDYAVGAEIIAPVHNADPSAIVAGAVYTQSLRNAKFRFLRTVKTLTLCCLIVEQFWKTVKA